MNSVEKLEIVSEALRQWLVAAKYPGVFNTLLLDEIAYGAAKCKPRVLYHAITFKNGYDRKGNFRLNGKSQDVWGKENLDHDELEQEIRKNIDPDFMFRTRHSAVKPPEKAWLDRCKS